MMPPILQGYLTHLRIAGSLWPSQWTHTYPFRLQWVEKGGTLKLLLGIHSHLTHTQTHAYTLWGKHALLSKTGWPYKQVKSSLMCPIKVLNRKSVLESGVGRKYSLFSHDKSNSPELPSSHKPYWLNLHHLNHQRPQKHLSGEPRQH